MEFILHLEAFSCPWGILFTLVELTHIRNLVAVLDVVITILEIVKFVFILSLLRFFFSRSQIRPSLKLAFAGIIQTIDSALLEADYISALEGRILHLTAYFSRCLGHVRCRIELTAEGAFVDLELEHFLVCIDEILVFIFVLQAILEREAFDVFTLIELGLDLPDD